MATVLQEWGLTWCRECVFGMCVCSRTFVCECTCKHGHTCADKHSLQSRSQRRSSQRRSGGVGGLGGVGRVDMSRDEKESLISRVENIRAHVCGALLCVICVHLRNATEQTAPSAGLILSTTNRESVVSATKDTLRISVHVLFKATLEKGVCMATAHTEGLHHDAKLLYADFSSDVGHPGCRVILRSGVLLWQ